VWVRRPKSAQALALRAWIVLAAAEGLGNTQIAERLGVRRATARTWRRRFAEHRLDGLLDEPRPDRPRTVTDKQVETVITRTLETTPANATHWSTRSLAAELGLSQSAVSRIWRAFENVCTTTSRGRTTWPVNCCTATSRACNLTRSQSR
jgi:transposase